MLILVHLASKTSHDTSHVATVRLADPSVLQRSSTSIATYRWLCDCRMQDTAKETWNLLRSTRVGTCSSTEKGSVPDGSRRSGVLQRWYRCRDLGPPNAKSVSPGEDVPKFLFEFRIRFQSRSGRTTSKLRKAMAWIQSQEKKCRNTASADKDSNHMLIKTLASDIGRPPYRRAQNRTEHHDPVGHGGRAKIRELVVFNVAS